MGYPSILKIIVSAAFLAFALLKIDLQAMADAIPSVHVGFYLVSLLIVLLNSLILALKFKLLLRPSGIYQSVATLFRINLICRFYAFLLTPAVGQGLIRWYRSTKNQDQRENFITVMVLERASFLFVLCFAVLVLQFTLRSAGATAIAQLVYPVALTGMLVTLLICAYLYSTRVNTHIDRLMAFITARLPRPLAQKLASRRRCLGIYTNRTNIILKCLLIAVAWHLLYMLRVFLLSAAIDVPLDFFQMGWMASLVLLLQVVPVTLNGIGLRESAYAMLFSLEAIPAEKGVLIGLLFFTQMLIVSAIGGVLNLFDRN
ncbi:MAG: lysylphosphatidylglycerol synthase transmembrane domain-containing protein [Desulfobacterales bacterium]